MVGTIADRSKREIAKLHSLKKRSRGEQSAYHDSNSRLVYAPFVLKERGYTTVYSGCCGILLFSERKPYKTMSCDCGEINEIPAGN